MLKWAGTNPVYIGVVILFGAGFIMAYPLASVFVLTVVAAGIGFVRWMIRLDKRSWEQIGRRQALIAHADYEHHLVMNGDPRGWFGQFPPAV